MYPDHQDQIKRLNKIQGQVKGITGMIEDRRYCLDILTQIKAATQALKKVELGILENHISHCVKDAAVSGDPVEIKAKIDEVMKLIASR